MDKPKMSDCSLSQADFEKQVNLLPKDYYDRLHAAPNATEANGDDVAHTATTSKPVAGNLARPA